MQVLQVPLAGLRPASSTCEIGNLMSSKRPEFTDQEVLRFHAQGQPGKISITPTKPMATQRDLAIAYSPGVAVPVRAIEADANAVYDYTAKGNLVAVVTNGTAILGLGDLGALAAKPVMEGKAVLFKRFADVDAMDIELDTKDTQTFIDTVQCMAPTFGGINLEDVKAPDCFIIEERLRELLNIPVFHDDQHGTAIIALAGLINACNLTKRRLRDIKMVVNGAGAAGIACLELAKAMGVHPENAILCDTKGVIYKGRSEGMNQWKSAHATTSKARNLEEAMVGADVFLGLSVRGALTPYMVRSMNERPIIFAMANPDPEITPEEVASIRSDAIMATGRSDYPNQINNVLGFPYIFRGALDVRATTINDAMKIAAAEALASLAREDVPDEVALAYAGMRPRYGADYIIPAPFDPRLIAAIPPAVAKAAMDTGVARKPIVDMDGYKNRLSARLNPAAGSFQLILEKVRREPKRVVFAVGEEEQVIRAAIAFRNAGLGTPVLIGAPERIMGMMADIGFDTGEPLEIHNMRVSELSRTYGETLYGKLQRDGYLMRDCQRLVMNDRNAFGASMVLSGDADALVTGLTRHYAVALGDVRRIIKRKENHCVIGVSILLCRGRTVFVADTTVHEMPSAEELADIAVEAAGVARRFGHEPRVALVSYSTFGQPEGERAYRLREAVAMLDRRGVDFEYDGEMAPDVALNGELMRLYPFCRLKEPANVLVMPAIHSASISSKLMAELGGSTVIGPVLVGLEKSVQIVPMGSTVSNLVNLAALAAYGL